MFIYLVEHHDIGKTILKNCDIKSFTLTNDYLDRELAINISTLTITVRNSKKIYEYFSKIKSIKPVKFVYEFEDELRFEDFLINPVLNIPLKDTDFLLTLTSPLTLFNIESNKVEYEGLIKKDEKTFINSNNESIFEEISNITNKLYKRELQILKVNYSLSEKIDKFTYTFLINEGENIFTLIKRLCFEFSLSIHWNDGIVIKDIKRCLKEDVREDYQCIVKENYNEEIILTPQNRLVIAWTDKNFKSILELLEEDLKSVYAEKGREVDNKLEPLKPLFEREYYPDYSDQFDNVKVIDVGFLTKKLERKKDGEIIGILSRNVRTEINPILLIEDPLMMFKPYNDYFKKLEPSKDIMSKKDFYIKYEIEEDDKIYKLLENRYPTEDDPDWQVDHPTKPFLMLRKFTHAEQSIIFSFQTQPRAVVDPLKPLYKDIFWIQIFASTHYRNTEFTMRPLEIINTREERRELYLYINELGDANEEYSFRQTLLLNGYNVISFESSKKLEPLNVYNLYNPLTETYTPCLIIKEEISFTYNEPTRFNYLGFKTFDFKKENPYLVEITTSILDIARKQLPILLKTIWDTNIRYSYYTHFYIDNLPKLAIDGADKNGLALVGYYTLYYINELPESKNLIKQAQGNREDLLLVTPKLEIEKVKEKFKQLFGFEPTVKGIVGVSPKISNQSVIVEGDFKGKEYGGEEYFAYPYREKFEII